MKELDLEWEPSNESIYFIVKLLKTSNVFSKFVHLFEGMNTFFLKKKKISFSQLNNDELVHDLMTLSDKINHLKVSRVGNRIREQPEGSFFYSYCTIINIEQYIHISICIYSYCYLAKSESYYVSPKRLVKIALAL